eukprot:gene42130-biopygen6182
MEYMALAAATAIKNELQAQEPIRTNCQAVVKILTSRHYHLRQKNTAHRALLQYATMYIDQGQCLPEHVMGHPERREPNREKWTRDQWGNHLADRAAEGEIGAFTQVAYQTITAKQWSGEMTIPGQWYLGDENTTPEDGPLAMADVNKLQKICVRYGKHSYALIRYLWVIKQQPISIRAEERKRQRESSEEEKRECTQDVEQLQEEGATPAVEQRPRRDRQPERFYNEEHRAEGVVPLLVNRSAFARKALAAGVRIGQYTGKYTNKGTHTHYVLHNPVADIYRDAWDHTLQRVRCLAAFLNEPLDQHRANCKFAMANGRMYMETIVPIPAHDELLVPYGDEYWLNNKFDKNILGKAYAEYKKESTMERWKNKIATAMDSGTKTEYDGTTIQQQSKAGTTVSQHTDLTDCNRTMPHWPQTTDENIRRRPERVSVTVDGVTLSMRILG